VGDKKLLQGRARMEVSYSHSVHLKQPDSENLCNCQEGKIRQSGKWYTVFIIKFNGAIYISYSYKKILLLFSPGRFDSSHWLKFNLPSSEHFLLHKQWTILLKRDRVRQGEKECMC